MMQRRCGHLRTRRVYLLGLAGLAILSAAAFVGLTGATPSEAEPQAQNAAAPPHYEYDVVSVKPSDPANTGKPGMGTSSSPDSFTAKSTSLLILLDYAFGIRNPEQLVGTPGWASNERFDLDAKMEDAVMDALQKLSREDRTLARQQMLQALLADRFKMIFHRETRELQVYTLAIGKSGSKMKEAKPGDTYPNGFKMPGGRGGGAGSMLFQAGPSGLMMTAQAVPLTQLIPTISREVGRIIIDKTGLTGNYDFVFQYTPDNFHAPANLGEAGSGAGMALPPDFGSISIFTAVQEQLGLKLESAKASIEVVVIDHIERPSGN